MTVQIRLTVCTPVPIASVPPHNHGHPICEHTHKIQRGKSAAAKCKEEATQASPSMAARMEVGTATAQPLNHTSGAADRLGRWPTLLHFQAGRLGSTLAPRSVAKLSWAAPCRPILVMIVSLCPCFC